MQQGITPLEVMLQAMRHCANDQDWKRAIAIAKHAAPYVHAKVAPVEYTGGNTSMPGADLRARAFDS